MQMHKQGFLGDEVMPEDANPNLDKCNLSGKTGGVSIMYEYDDGNRIMSYMKGALK